MPIVRSDGYRPVAWLRNGHVQTLFPVALRPQPEVSYTRERLELADGDFIDLDWSPAPVGDGHVPKLALVVHGLEGHAGRKYVRGMVRTLNVWGWDCCAMNHRGCSGEMNRLARMYHSGETDDLHAALVRALGARHYECAALVGFSMGGNQILKYLGEAPARVPAEVAAAVAVSAPCDLASCTRELETGFSRLYQAYLMNSLKKKIRAKHPDFPDELPLDGLERMRDFREFDDAYTAPLGGYASAMDYYVRCSSLPVLPAIQVPTLILNAQNDPFLAPECFPRALAERHPRLYLETPTTGGHVGFATSSPQGPYWSETRTPQFLAHYTP